MKEEELRPLMREHFKDAIAPFEELEKTCRIILGFATGATVLLLNWMKDLPRTAAVSWSLFFSVLFFGLSVFVWLVFNVFMLRARNECVRGIVAAFDVKNLEKWRDEKGKGVEDDFLYAGGCAFFQAMLFSLGVLSMAALMYARW